jgi:acetolactate synthase-1/2/3 large subunit
MSETTVEVMADAFKEMGTPFIVGHPGGDTVHLMDAARERDMRYILMKQEVAGAIMAATWGEITGSPGVCTSTRGPGATNMVNGIAYAWSDRAPLLALTDQYPTDIFETRLRQTIDHQKIYAPITKWNTTLQANTARLQLHHAIQVATSPTPGPVHIDLPSTHLTQESSPLMGEPALLPERVAIDPDKDALRKPIDLINKASKPVILAGLGIYWDKASSEFVALAEHLGAPVLTTSKCKGVIPEDHELSAGCIIGGLIERELVMQSDLIITIGLDVVELQPKPWPYKIPVLSLTNVPTLNGLVPFDLEMVGDLKLLLHRLSEFCQAGQGWGIGAASDFRIAVSNALNTPSTGLSPQAAMEAVVDVTPRDTVATCDAGASRLLVVQKWKSHGERNFLTSNGLGTMGYAIPGALAARIARPQSPVIAFAGDGGFLMAVAELQTSVKENLPIIVVVFDDEEIALIRIKQAIKGVKKYGVDIGGLNWESLAHGFGADGVVVDSASKLADAIQAAIKSGRTTLVVARIDGSGYIDQFNALREV